MQIAGKTTPAGEEKVRFLYTGGGWDETSLALQVKEGRNTSSCSGGYERGW